MDKKPLRTEMPECAAFLDAMREAFGEDVINDSIRRGIRGEPTFFASENGRQIGTKNVCSSYGPDPLTGQIVERKHDQ